MLTINATPSSLNLRAERGGAVKFTLSSVVVNESDTNLSQRLVSATLNWGDGSPLIYLGSSGPVQFPVAVPSPINIPILVTSFKPGLYVVVISARNYREPVYDQAQKVITVNVIGETVPKDELGKTIGPILPRDSGYPNAQQWNFDVKEDLLVLESSVKSILLTAKGDRVMSPSFGTNLHNMVFEPDAGAVEALVREDILRAISEFEPRVALDTIVIERAPNERQVTVKVTFVSKLSSQAFQVSMKYDR